MKKTLKKLKNILPAKDKAKVFVLFLLMLIESILEVLSIGTVAGFVAVAAEPDIIFNIEPLANALGALGIKTQQDILIWGSVFLVTIFFIKNTYIIFFKYIKKRFLYNRYRTISQKLFDVYLYAPYSFHLKRNSADLIRNITTESLALVSKVIGPILGILAEAVIVVGIIALLLIVEPLITIAVLILLGGTAALFLKATKKRIHEHGKRALKERMGIIKIANEGVGGIKSTAVMHRQNWFAKRFQKSLKDLARAHIFKGITNVSITPITEFIAVLGMIVTGLLLLVQGYTVGTLASMLALFALSVRRLLPAVKKITGEYNNLRYYKYTVDSLYEDLMMPYGRENKKKENSIDKVPLRNKIELKNVSFIYPGSEEKVLKNISLIIPKGTVAGFVGATGSGKTTLADLILGLLDPTEGKVLLDGKDIKENIEGWQKNIGYIPQSIYLSDDTIRNNIAFGIEEDEIDEKKIKEAVKAAQLEEFINRLPEGLDTMVGEKGVRLSGGQTQRVGIARALYNNPEVLVMDEATSSLDVLTEKLLVEAVEKLKKERTIIIITHRLKTVKNCNNLYLIEKGKIIARGNYKELLEKSNYFREMNDG